MVFDSTSKPRLGFAARNARRHNHMQKQTLQVRATGSCTGTGLLYEQPASGVSIDSAKDTTLQWNPSCLDNGGSGEIDIYLYAPQQPTANLPIHAWTHVPANQGSFDVKLAPKWWNASASVELSLNIVPTGNQPWDSANPFGPTWTAVYNAPTDGSKPPQDAIVGSGENKLISIFYSGGHITQGGKAAAIICPLLVLFIGLGILIRKMHIARNNKTADWAEHMDKRMSQISLDWTAGGDGRQGPVPGTRPASFVGRPQSSFRPSLDNVRALYNANLAGASTSQTNVAGLGAQANEMSEAGSQRPSNSIFRGNDRASRVSFAPSTDAATSIGHFARGHKTSASIPRVGALGATLRGSSLRDSTFAVPKIDPRYQSRSQLMDAEEDDDDELVMSPTQEKGAAPVNMDRLRRSIDDDVRNSMLAYPALEMVTRDNAETNWHQQQQYDGDSTARPISTDSAYAPGMVYDETAEAHGSHGSHSVHSSNHSVTLTQQASPQMQTGMLPPVNATSPDEALRQYAAQRAAGGVSPMPSTPASANNTMRTLFTSSPQPPASTTSSTYIDAPTAGHRTQHSIEAPSTINEDDVVGYNEMIHDRQ